ncbi:hypothetical protein [Hymenobacter terricola]|uniref:hypothetical protein n=1 Tax=Hymenobacter terricola TaxID=2819236 RepID=UPI001B3149E7|nr:hypothetical protein [Hymenobacter terricola]
MKNYLASLLLLLAVTGSLSSCRDHSVIPEPVNESIPLIIPEINPNKATFSFNDARLSVSAAAAGNVARPVFEFVVNPSQGYTDLQTVEVYKCIRRSGVLGPRVKVTDLNSFPATVSINSQDALRDLYVTSPTASLPAPVPVLALASSPTQANRILNSDAVVFTFEYVMKDGRRIVLTPLSTADGSVGAPTGAQTNAPLAAVATFKI